MVLALFVIAFKGSAAEGQESLLNRLFHHYVEETAASVIPAPSQYKLAELNSVSPSLAAVNMATQSRTANMDDSPFLSRATILADVIDDLADRGNQVINYEIQDGESISGVAYDFGVSVQTILWANNIKNPDSIRAGTVLKIPPVSGVLYTIKSGDTIGSIAKKYSAEQEKITEFNRLVDDTSLKIGQQIIIPDGKVPSGTTPANNQTSATRFAHLPTLDGFFGHPTSGLGMNWGKIHGRNGVDIANPCGTTIYASADGVVKKSATAGYNGGFGRYILLAHANGLETLYAHLSGNSVKAGETVKKGQQIGLMGSTGRSTGCHVHYEVHGARNPLAKY